MASDNRKFSELLEMMQDLEAQLNPGGEGDKNVEVRIQTDGSGNLQYWASDFDGSNYRRIFDFVSIDELFIKLWEEISE